MRTDPPTLPAHTNIHPPTNRQDRLQYTAPQLARSLMMPSCQRMCWLVSSFCVVLRPDPSKIVDPKTRFQYWSSALTRIDRVSNIDDFLLTFRSNGGHILYRFQDKYDILADNNANNFFWSHIYSTPSPWWFRLEYCVKALTHFGSKTWMMGYLAETKKVSR